MNHHFLGAIVDKVELILVWTYLDIVVQSHLVCVEGTHLVDATIKMDVITCTKHPVRRVVSVLLLLLLHVLV